MVSIIWIIFSVFMLASYIVAYMFFKNRKVEDYNRIFFFLKLIMLSFTIYGIMHLFPKTDPVILIKEIFETTAYVALVVFGVLLWKVEK